VLSARVRHGVLGAVTVALLASCGGSGNDNVLRIPLGAGGVGFLPLLMMREHGLVEQAAARAGIEDLTVEWIALGGPAVMNDALLSGSVDVIAAGPPAFLTLWDRTRGTLDVKGIAAMSSIPMYLNTRSERLTRLDDVGPADKIAITAIKVSIPAIIMQMYAAERYGAAEAERFDRYTVSMTHPDGVLAMLSGSSEINLHFTSPPFHQRESKDPSIRTLMTTSDVMGGATTFTMLSTTRAFHDERPDVYRALLAALEESMHMIRADPREAARVLDAAGGGAGLTVEELAALVQDPDIEFTTTPANVVKYAEFMHSIGNLEAAPESWRDLFFAEIHAAPGS
jgi:NitT/TauT family transport system substrate-binding protein